MVLLYKKKFSFEYIFKNAMPIIEISSCAVHSKIWTTQGLFSLATESESKHFQLSENRKSESQAESERFHFLLIPLMTPTLMTPVKTRLSEL